MTREEAVAILIRQIDEDPFERTEYREQIHDALNMAIEALREKSNILSEYEKLVDSLEDVTPKEASQMVDDFCIDTMRKMLADHYSKIILVEDRK